MADKKAKTPKLSKHQVKEERVRVASIEFMVNASRVLLIVWQYISNLLLEDHHADAFQFIPEANKTVADKVIDHFLGGFLRWDAHHFMHIAKHGYTFEHSIAFLPLYPLITSIVSYLPICIVHYVSAESILLVFFIILNVVFFKWAAITLYYLTMELFNEEIAYRSAVLFCFNPASIFFIAPYTETLFSFLTFAVMFSCVKAYQHFLHNNGSVNNPLIPATSVCVALSAATRSNGILNVGFFWYLIICMWFKGRRDIKTTCQSLFTLIVWTVVQLIPFALYCMYCLAIFCSDSHEWVKISPEVRRQAETEKFVLPGSGHQPKLEVCYSLLPYTYVQSHYWNVGFLKYFEFKQLPNFLLALPIISIIVVSSLRHFYVNFWKGSVFNLFQLENPKSTSADVLHQPRLTVFYVHAFFLALFCFFCMHVQVATRMLCSSSPLLYWICAVICKEPSEFPYLTTRRGGLVTAYFLSYFFIGTFMFCNFLPWT